MTWKNHIKHIAQTLDNLSVHNETGEKLSSDEAFLIWKEMVLEIRNTGKRIFFIGNGASASMASHFAADLGKNGGILTEVFTDMSLMTAISNDISYEHVFSEPLGIKLQKGDMLVSISSSGNSPNVIRGTKTAIKNGGKIVTISAMKPANKLRKLGHLNFYIPASTYGTAESGHAVILHFWTDQVINDIT